MLPASQQPVSECRPGERFSCPRANTGADWGAVDKGVSAVGLDESPWKAGAAGVPGFTGLRSGRGGGKIPPTAGKGT